MDTLRRKLPTKQAWAAMTPPIVILVGFFSATLWVLQPPKARLEILEKSDAGHQLSRASAGWAVIALALGTMTNLPSNIGGCPEELTFYLKASPFVCLLNIWQSVLVFVYHMRWNAVSTGFWGAFEDLAREKFGPTPFERSSKRFIRYVLFLFGVLPPAIKLYASREVLGTQLIGSCYLVDLVFDETIYRVALHKRPHQRHSPSTGLSQQAHGDTGDRLQFVRPTTAHGSRNQFFSENQMITVMALTAVWSVAVLSWSFARLMVEPMVERNLGKPIDRFPWLFLLLYVATVVFYSLPCICCIWQCWPNPRQRRNYIAGIGYILALGQFPLSVTLFLISFPKRLMDLVSQFCILAPTLLALSGIILLVKRLQAGQASIEPHDPQLVLYEFCAPYFVFFASLANLVLYFLLFYSPSQSYKPEWTEYFG